MSTSTQPQSPPQSTRGWPPTQPQSPPQSTRGLPPKGVIGGWPPNDDLHHIADNIMHDILADAEQIIAHLRGQPPITPVHAQ